MSVSINFSIKCIFHFFSLSIFPSIYILVKFLLLFSIKLCALFPSAWYPLSVLIWNMQIRMRMFSYKKEFLPVTINEMARFNINITTTIYFEIAVTAGLFFILCSIFVWSIWTWLMYNYIKEAKKSIRNLTRIYEDEILENKILIIRADITKYKLMLATLLLEQLLCLSLFLLLVGTILPVNILSTNCFNQIETLEYALFTMYTFPYILVICMTGSLTAIVFYIKHSLSKNYNTKVVQKISACITLQVVILVSLNLWDKTNYISSYLFIACNIGNFTILCRGAKQLRRVLKWRTQDASYYFNPNSRKTRMYRRIEKNYKIMTACMCTVLGIIIFFINMDLLVDKGLIPLITNSGCEGHKAYNLLQEELVPIVEKYNLNLFAHSGRMLFLAVRVVAGFSYGILSLAMYTAVLVKMWIQQRRGPKYTRFRVDYAESYIAQPLLIPVS